MTQLDLSTRPIQILTEHSQCVQITKGVSPTGTTISNVSDGSVTAYGKLFDTETRCVHWHTLQDIIALRFACCGKYWCCYECHLAESQTGGIYHNNQNDSMTARKYKVLEDDRDLEVILCGHCGAEFTFKEYVDSNYVCRCCASEFNPGCKLHYGIYFDLEI